MKERLLSLVVKPWFPVAAALLAVVLCLPSLGFGLLADDHLHRAKILRHKGQLTLPVGIDVPVKDPARELFVFYDGTPWNNRALANQGLIPWWASLDLKAAFYRPLSAYTHILDYELWPGSPWLMHLHSLVWLALAVLSVALLYRRFLGSGAVAGTALLLFALEDAHAAPAAWIANRNALIAVCLGAGVLALHHRWRRQGWDPGLPLATALLLAALLACEMSLAVCGYLLAYALFLDRRSLFSRALSLLPYAVVTLLWLAWYRVGGFGTSGALSYVNPLTWDFPAAVAERLPLLLATQWLQIPADPWIAVSRAAQLIWSAISLALVAGGLVLLAPLLRNNAQARFWATGMVLAAVPVCASFPMDRLLMFVGLGAMPLFALLLQHSGWLRGRVAGGLTRRAAVAGLVLLHLWLTPVLLPLRVLGTGYAFGTFTTAAEALPPDPALARQTLVFVNGTSIAAGYVPILRALDNDAVPRRTTVLGHMLSTMELTRSDERSLTIRAKGGFLATPAEALLRSTIIPFSRGQECGRAGVAVTIDEVTADGRPEVVTFRFPERLEDPSLRWVYFVDAKLVPFSVPAVGQTVTVEPSWIF